MYHLWKKTAGALLFLSMFAAPSFAAGETKSADVAEVAAVEVTGSRLAADLCHHARGDRRQRRARRAGRTGESAGD